MDFNREDPGVRFRPKPKTKTYNPSMQRTVSLSDDISASYFHHAFDSLLVEPSNVEIFAGGVTSGNPYMLCGLCATTAWVRHHGHDVVIHVPYASRRLEAMEFYGALADGVHVVDRGPPIGGVAEPRALLPVRRILDDKDINHSVGEFIENARAYGGWIGGFSKRIGEECIAETLDNCLQHSKSPVGAFVGAWALSASEMCIAAVDVGQGIPTHLRHNFRYAPLSDRDALKKAVEDRASGIDDSTRGFGLGYVRAAARLAGRSLLAIRAGEGELKVDIGKRDRRLTFDATAIPGTWMRIEIRQN